MGGKYLNVDFLPFEIEYLDGGYYFLSVEKSAATQIPLGSRIIAMNGMPAQEYMDKHVIPYVSGGTLQDRIKKALVYLSMSDTPDTPLRLEIETPGGETGNYLLKYNARQEKLGKEDILTVR